MPLISIALLIAAALGGGASLAAQNSMPGDLLWGFKVGVNENIEAALAPEGEAQANFDIAAIQSRVKEAAQLSAQSKLSADAKADIETNFDEHAKSVQEQIAKLQEKGDYAAAADVATRFQAAVAANASTLAESSAEADASAGASAELKSNLNSLMMKVRGTLDEASAISEDSSAKAAADAEIHGSTSTSSGASGGTTVKTGTSVQGGEGGIKVDSETGSEIGI